MPRRRLCVALVCPPRLAGGVDDLRRLLGDDRLDVMGPHVTLVPPVNVPVDDVPAALDVVRAAARSGPAADLQLGPAATFAPGTPTVHLDVDGPPDELARLVAWRGGLFTGPFSRPDTRPWHPHVTLRRSADEPLRSAALTALGGRLGPWRPDRVHLLEHGEVDGRRRWWTLAEEPFGGPEVSGRGGIELHARAVRAVEPAAAELLGRPDAARQVVGTDPGRRLVLVVERADGSPLAPVAVAAGTTDGRTARLDAVVVDPAAQRLGIGRRTLLGWCSAAADRGAEVVVVDRAAPAPAAAAGADALLAGCGFAAVGDLMVRRP